MTTFAIIALGFSLLAAAAVLCRAVARAPEGYEDDLGFHAGIEPRFRGAMAAAARIPFDQDRGDGADFPGAAAPQPQKTAGTAAMFPSHKGLPTHVHGAL